MSVPRSVVTCVDGLDAIAWRTGTEVLIHISDALPAHNHTAIVDYLRNAVEVEPGEEATVCLRLGEAITLSSYRPPVPSPRKSREVAAFAAGSCLPSAAALAVVGLSSDAPAEWVDPYDSTLDHVLEPELWLYSAELDHQWPDALSIIEVG